MFAFAAAEELVGNSLCSRGRRGPWGCGYRTGEGT